MEQRALSPLSTAGLAGEQKINIFLTKGSFPATCCGEFQ